MDHVEGYPVVVVPVAVAMSRWVGGLAVVGLAVVVPAAVVPAAVVPAAVVPAAVVPAVPLLYFGQETPCTRSSPHKPSSDIG